MSKADDILFFDVILSIMLFAFGAGTQDINLATFTSLPTPPIESFPALNKCSVYDIPCNAANLNTATAFIGVALFNLLALFGYVIFEVVLFLETILSIVFSPALTQNGVPFLGFIYTGLQIYVLWEVFRTLRGSSTGI